MITEVFPVIASNMIINTVVDPKICSTFVISASSVMFGSVEVIDVVQWDLIGTIVPGSILCDGQLIVMSSKYEGWPPVTVRFRLRNSNGNLMNQPM